MSETITVEISDELAARARAVAAATNRRFEEVVSEWLGRGAAEPAFETLSDEELLDLCDAKFSPAKQSELSDLLARNRESILDSAAQRRLDELMSLYRRNLVAKARAWQEAVARGLRTPLSEDAA